LELRSKERGAGSSSRFEAAAEGVDHTTLLCEVIQQEPDTTRGEILLSVQKQKHVRNLKD
jgi:hypothetical protein